VLNINLEQIGAKSRMIDGVGANGPSSQEEILRAHKGRIKEFHSSLMTLEIRFM